ncbi:PorE family type IX secretion system protein [Mangrovibacterium lignilyticum]|uniref:PorE family type IX secretion system protein n=1 Tax=Mangrovibacterium lignilyticum TaxID=2668052 RepID=UPI0013D5872E|nr:OmpA family protein [Mangrovibacterium lignilyticum]
MKRILLARFVLVGFMLILGACSSQKMYRSGMSSVEMGEYYRSAEKFRKAYRKDKDPQHRMEMAYQTAEAYRKLGDFGRAAIWYKNTIRRNYPDKKAILYCADCLRAYQNLEEAEVYYQQYLELFPDDPKALSGLEACKFVPEWEANPTRYIVAPVRELSSRYSDYAPVFVAGKDNEVILSSMRESEMSGKRESAITGQHFSDLFRSEFQLQKQKWSEPELIDDSGIINTDEDEGAAAISPNGDLMVFTRCRFDKSNDMGASLFAARMSRGNWSEPILQPLTSDSLIAAHPAFSPDGNTLYFVSNLLGGYGGTDIWMATREGNSFSKPVNLGSEINTPGNEVFPSMDWEGNLYFSSDYHPGMGGLDIFKATKDEDGKWAIENLRVPINSSGDDFGMSFIHEEDPHGLFASNRKGSRSDDIYSFYLPPKVYRITGEIYDKETGRRIDGVRVRVIATDGTNLRMRANDGKFQVKLNPETEYVFAAYRDGYLNDKVRETTIGLTDSKDFHVNLYLTPTDSPIKVDNISYAFGAYELNEASKNSLDSVVQVLELNPTITIELMSHTDYVGSDRFNFDLSQKRAQAAVEYLIQQGINPDRLVAKGYGETWPKKVTRELARQYDFLKRNDELTEEFINRLTPEQQEIAKSINRRTEFRVLSTDYHEKYTPETK